MDINEAYKLFKLEPAAGVPAAERVYNNLRGNILNHLDQPGTDTIQRSAMEQALARFETAISVIRESSQEAVIPDNWQEDEASTPAASPPSLTSEPPTPMPGLPPEPMDTQGSEPELVEVFDNNRNRVIPRAPLGDAAALAENTSEESSKPDELPAVEQEPHIAPGFAQSPLGLAAIGGAMIVLLLSVWLVFSLISPDEEPTPAPPFAKTVTPPTNITPVGKPLDPAPAPLPEPEIIPGLVPETAFNPMVEELAQEGVQAEPANEAALYQQEVENWQSLLATEVARLQQQGLPEWPIPDTALADYFEPDAVLTVVKVQANLKAAETVLEGGNYQEAAKLLQQAYLYLSSIQVNAAESAEATEIVEVTEEIPQEEDTLEATLSVDALYELGLEALSELRLTRPFDRSAMAYVQRIEALDPDARDAADLRQKVHEKYLELAGKSLNDDEFKEARKFAKLAQSIVRDREESGVLLQEIQNREAQFVEARFIPKVGIAENAGVAMVKLPSGQFMLGAPDSPFKRFAGFLSTIGNNNENENNRDAKESPQTLVSIAMPFAISATEITVEQFDHFVEDTGYVTDAEQRGSSAVYFGDIEIELQGRNWRQDFLGNPAVAGQPVVYISHRDATRFAQWMSETTGATYRLPSEIEFEYAARSGTTDPLPWTSSLPPKDTDNFRGSDDRPPAGWDEVTGGARVRSLKGWSDGYFGPAKANAFKANNFGLRGMLGNVAEWVADCYSEDYLARGTNQAPFQDNACDFRMIRGGDWAADSRLLRLSYRSGKKADFSSNRIGFRVAREFKTLQ